MFWQGFVAGAVLVLLAVALLMGLGMVLYRKALDAGMGYDWRDDWKQTLKRWRL